MCILFIATNPDVKPGGYRLIVASNRDEYYSRPSLDAALDEENGIIGGSDMQDGREGGMWLGVSFRQHIRMGALLNVTGETTRGKGRGFIVKDFLKSTCNSNYLEELQKTSSEYSAFNFVTVDMSREDTVVGHLSNSPVDLVSFQGAQILGFGNSPLATPLMKVLAGKERFKEIVEGHNDMSQSDKLIEDLFGLLKWTKRHLPDVELQKRAPQAYEYLSSVCVNVEQGGYGTRAHTIILVDHDWNVDFIESVLEQPIDPGHPKWRTRRIKRGSGGAVE